MEFLPYAETPIIEITDPLCEKAGVRVLIKREDLNHHLVSGNKWWKLKYNLISAAEAGANKILTFGGAFSNHIYATAAAAGLLGFESIGVIRGEETLPLNPTLSYARCAGMRLHYVSRGDYRSKNENHFIDKLHDLYSDFFLIPEGGTNRLAIKGTTELGLKIFSQSFDSLFVAAGTAGTISGIILASKGQRQIFGVPVMKQSEFLHHEIENHVGQNNYSNWGLVHGYDHGGYAKTTPELISFIKAIYSKHALPLDHVYTGKLLFAVFEEIRKGNIRKGNTVLCLHTGGLQGSTLYREPI